MLRRVVGLARSYLGAHDIAHERVVISHLLVRRKRRASALRDEPLRPGRNDALGLRERGRGRTPKVSIAACSSREPHDGLVAREEGIEHGDGGVRYRARILLALAKPLPADPRQTSASPSSPASVLFPEATPPATTTTLLPTIGRRCADCARIR